MKERLKEAWLRRKLYNWQNAPASSRGWIVTFAYILLAMILLRFLTDDASSTGSFFSVFLPMIFLSIFFLYVCHKKKEVK